MNTLNWILATTAALGAAANVALWVKQRRRRRVQIRLTPQGVEYVRRRMAEELEASHGEGAG